MTTKLLASIENATGVRLRASELLRQPDLRGIATLLYSHGEEMRLPHKGGN